MRPNPNMHPRAKGVRRARCGRHATVSWLFTAALCAGCVRAPDRHIAAAPLNRLGQSYEVLPLAVGRDDCRFRTRLDGPTAVDAWIGIRNSAVHAAARAAVACCRTPRVARISDWMAGFAAWEVTFDCTEQSPSSTR